MVILKYLHPGAKYSADIYKVNLADIANTSEYQQKPNTTTYNDFDRLIKTLAASQYWKMTSGSVHCWNILATFYSDTPLLEHIKITTGPAKT